MREVGLRHRRFTENTWIKHSPKVNGEMFSRIYPLLQLTRYLILRSNSRITNVCTSVFDLLLGVHVDSLENIAKLFLH